MRVHTLLVLLLVSVAVLSSPHGNTPGTKVTISQNALQYMTNQVLPIIEKQVSQQLAIPDSTSEVDTPIGHVTLEAKNIKVQSFHLAAASLTVLPGKGLQANIQGCSVAIHLDWHYRKNSWPHVSDGGSADSSVSLNVALVLAITVGPDGKPVVQVPAVSTDVTGLDLHLHGGASWLYNIFLNVFKNSIRKSITSAIESNMSKAVTDNVAKILATINLKYPLRDGVIVDASFDEILFGSSFLTTGNMVEFIYLNGTRYPGQPPAMPDTDPKYAGSMIQFAMSDYVLNTAAYAAFQAEPTHMLVNSSYLPSSLQFLMNTRAFKFLIPQLYNTYPDLPMQITIGVTSAPTFKVSPDVGTELSAEGDANFQVIQKGGAIASVFDIGVQAVLDANVMIVAQKNVTAELSVKKLSITLKESVVGPFDISVLQEVVSTVVAYVLVPIVNLMAKNYPLTIPTVEGISLVNPGIAYNNDFVQVYSNFTYVPAF